MIVIIIQSAATSFRDRLPEDGKLNFTQLANKYGHECVEHDVVTEDGYILKLFNIVGNKSRPIFLQHGFMDSSDTFIIRGNTSLAIALAEEGYDVWAGNTRGNEYARGHLTLNPETDKKAFFNYSQHEMAVYDLPAMIDYVLHETRQTQLKAIGHSQGTMIFYILAAEKPEYNDKIKLFISLAPICYLHHTKPLTSTAIKLWPLVEPFFKELGIVEAFSRNSTAVALFEFICTTKDIGYPLCITIMFSFAGFDRKELERKFVPVISGHFPNTASTKNGDHLVQIALKKRFSKYDYGEEGNVLLYGTSEPPNYDLKNVRMPVALISARNDKLSALKDVAILRDALPNVVYDHVMERRKYNHIDYVWGKNAPQQLYPMVFKLLNTTSYHRISKLF
ncbi:lipase 1-like [Ostrinia furnacalis]|uniref:lipase 1-like n=1 Tax=Ostrinia furnacalis TaxID=93504 RepID=UPI00103A21FD|nr:lipase 1-like [Ostrinia furnacalis]